MYQNSDLPFHDDKKKMKLNSVTNLTKVKNCSQSQQASQDLTRGWQCHTGVKSAKMNEAVIEAQTGFLLLQSWTAAQLVEDNMCNCLYPAVFYSVQLSSPRTQLLRSCQLAIVTLPLQLVRSSLSVHLDSSLLTWPRSHKQWMNALHYNSPPFSIHPQHFIFSRDWPKNIGLQLSKQD